MFRFNMEGNSWNTYQRFGLSHDEVCTDASQSEVKVSLVQLCVDQQNVTLLWTVRCSVGLKWGNWNDLAL